ncbi:hypothetical protein METBISCDRAFT_26248 [Metschnikowia bicuspidata]|uniref:Autophagy-related protein 11 n=1 Tax=Metschnikowia bicuspidata TaxID=27322 RepID=A0A4P9ZFF0_9ASCO|nr:hypothetical protein METBISCDRAFT_26248 [Metschnikowia bicuspidata]
MATAVAQLSVYNAHNGELLEIPKPVRFHTLVSLKAYLLETWGPSASSSTDDVILFTPFGIKLNFQMVNEMQEIFYFDRHLFNQYTPKADALRYCSFPEDSELLTVPGLFVFPDETDPSGIADAFERYEQWAMVLVRQTARSLKACDQLVKRINYIFKSLNIIFQFVCNFVKSSEKSFNTYYASIKVLWTKSLRTSWHSHYSALKSISNIPLKNNTVSLASFLDKSALARSAEFVDKYLPQVVERFNGFSATVTSMNDETLSIDRMIEVLRTESGLKFKGYDAKKKSLLQDTELFKATLAEDVRIFYSPSKREQRLIYLQHKELSRHFVLTAAKINRNMGELVEFRKKLVLESVPIFQAIALLQKEAVTLRNDSRALMVKPTIAEFAPAQNSSTDAQPKLSHLLVEQIKNAEDYLSMTIDLPLVFGFTLIEKRRQFEWHDFYLNGLVNGVSEQLTLVIDYERSFQTLWIKKFGHYIKQLSKQLELSPQVPAIDVTLVNGNPTSNPRSIFAWIDTKEPERENILSYIGILKGKNFDKFAHLLEKNYKDMVYSTDQINKMMRIVASLSAYAFLNDRDSQQSRQKSVGAGNETEEPGLDLSLVEGLKLRIKKLENLLHQCQYRNLKNWPVVRTDQAASNSQTSLIVTEAKDKQDSLKLLHKETSSPVEKVSRSSSRVLEASSINKHIEKIRPDSEYAELVAKNQELIKKNQEYENRIRELERQLEQRNSDYSSLENALDSAEHKLKDLEREKAAAEKHAETLRYEKTKIEADFDSLKVEYASSRAELQDLAMTKEQLVGHIMEKEQDFASEKLDLRREISELSAQIERRNTEYQRTLEEKLTKQQNARALLESLNDALMALFQGIQALSSLTIDYFREFCLVMQSMGLLLVKEPRADNGKLEYRIKRVKGLRARNIEDTEADTVPEIKTIVINDVEEAFLWLKTARAQLDSIKEIQTPAQSDQGRSQSNRDEIERVEAQSRLMVDAFLHFLLSEQGQASLLEQATKIMSFQHNVQFQGHDNKAGAGEGFFYNGLVKRFNDVEGYAKKLTKENKAKSAELAKSIRAQNMKLNINNFRVGDLVLFLPTMKSDDADDKELAPWTAFNIDAPNYFLDVESQPKKLSKQWVVNRITSIEPHEVTEENAADKSKHPVSLSVGDKWYLVSTKPN